VRGIAKVFFCICVFLLGTDSIDAVAGEAVEVRIDTVLATNSGQETDQRLMRMRRQFRSFRYSSFRLIQAESRRVAWGIPVEFALPGGRALEVLPQEYKDDWVGLRVRLLAVGGALMETRLRLRNQGTILLGGPKHDQGVLIISITAGTD
jgi:hypothetical protein